MNGLDICDQIIKINEERRELMKKIDIAVFFLLGFLVLIVLLVVVLMIMGT